MKDQWVVTYCDLDENPVALIFDNEEAAKKCYNYYDASADRANIEKVTVHSKFTL